MLLHMIPFPQTSVVEDRGKLFPLIRPREELKYFEKQFTALISNSGLWG